MNDNQKIWVVISIFCLCILWVPVISISIITAPQRVTQRFPGLVRIEPGHSYLTDIKSARINPLTQRVFITETLNRIIADNAFDNPVIGQKIKLSESELFPEIVQVEDSKEIENLIRIAKTKNIKWDATAGDWGMFLLENDQPPVKTPTFGMVELPGGKEKSTFLVEKNINLLLNWVREKRDPKNRTKPETILAILKETLKEEDSPISTQGAIELYGLSNVLNINYDKETNLFLSPESKIIVLSLTN